MRWSSQVQVAPVLGRTKSGNANEKQEFFSVFRCNRWPKRRGVLRRDGKLCVFSACYLAFDFSMDLHGKTPIRGKSTHLNEVFGEWWYLLNGIGILAFELFLECRGAGDDSHFYAFLSWLLMIWLLWISHGAFPKVVKKIRKSENVDDKLLAREIVRDYLSVMKMPVVYFPYMLGWVSVSILALLPLLTGDFHAYIPSFAK